MTAPEIPTKWQFITQKCYEERKYLAAFYATKIDQLLMELYPYHKHTNAWITAYKNGTVARDTREYGLMTAVIAEGEYCVACLYCSDEDCYDCAFADAAGGTCGDLHSIYTIFCESYAADSRN